MKHLIIAFILIGIPAFTQPPGYSFGKHILIQSSQVVGPVNLINFPVLISFTDADLRTISNGGNIENTNGYDIIFTMGDCSTQLDHQIEQYNASTGEYIAWVNIPLLPSTTNHGIHMYYGNSAISTNPSTTSTWNSNYEAVWHMNNNPSTSTLTDYSGNGVNGASHGSMTTSDLVSGKIGDAIDFDGSNDYFSLASKNYTTSNIITQISISAWVRTNYTSTSYSNNWSILDFDRSEYFNMYVHGDGRLGFSSSATSSSIHDAYGGTSGDLNDNTWHYVTGVYNGTDKLYYIDGNLVLTSGNPHGGLGIGRTVTRYGFIGDGSEASSYNGGRNNIYYDGQYDEIRFTTSALSSDWIQTEFNNQNSPASFYTVSTQFTAGVLCATLPVELISFSASIINYKDVKLKWETASEKNNDVFTVQRSPDGLIWEKLADIDGAGNSATTLNYATIDPNPYFGSSYYRLKQTDFNGGYSYSNIETVNIDKPSDFRIYPNPVINQVTVIGNQFEMEAVKIINALGQDVTHLTSSKLNDKAGLTINLSQLTKGFYFIKTKTTIHKVYKL